MFNVLKPSESSNMVKSCVILKQGIKFTTDLKPEEH